MKVFKFESRVTKGHFSTIISNLDPNMRFLGFKINLEDWNFDWEGKYLGTK